MSFAGQVLCQRIEIGPWALAIIGKPRAVAPPAAAAAPVRNLRRETSGVRPDTSGFACSLLIRSLLTLLNCYEQGLCALRWPHANRQGLFSFFPLRPTPH